MPYRNKEAIWTYGPTHPGAFLCLITPYEYILNQSLLVKGELEYEISQLIQLTHYGMVLTLSIVIILAFLFSRTVTKPLKALVDGAKELAAGNFDVRVHIRSKDEFGKMGKVFNLVGPQLEERYQMRQLLDVAMEVQQNLLPKSVPDIPGMDIAGKSVYCNETGGDYYDFIEKSNKVVDIVVGDVAGHGIPSALLMTTARAFIRQRAWLDGSPARIVSDVNMLLSKDTEDSGQFMTLFYVRIDIESHIIKWVMAGHDPAIIYDKASDTFEKLSGKGIPLGVFEDYDYHENQSLLKKGQLLIAGTDGIREAFNPEGEMFGTERLHQTIRDNASLNAKTMIENILNTLNHFQAGRPSEDDLTLVIVKIKE